MQASLISWVAGCQAGGPLFVSKPIDMGEPLIIPTSVRFKKYKSKQINEHVKVLITITHGHTGTLFESLTALYTLR